MANQFNLIPYKELLELEKTNKITFLDIELLTYRASIESQTSYERKDDYFSLIEKYLRKKITGYEFRSKFREMELQDSSKAYIISQDFQNLEVFILAGDLEEFSSLILEIAILCLEFDELWDGTIERMSESKFYSLVNKYYFQLAELFPIVSINNLPYQKLISRSFQNLAGIIGLGY
jgi:hypothetical protein